MADTATRTPSFPEVGIAILHGLYAHRLLSTPQIHELYAPDLTRRWPLAVLARLEAAGYVRRIRVAARRSRRPSNAWYLTPPGYTLVEEGGGADARPYRMTPERAAGPLQSHTLLANDIGTLFVRAARRFGDYFGPADWRLETAWRLGPRPRAEVLVSDLVIHYTLYDGPDGTYLPRFVEVDRATTSVRTLVTKVEAYARLAAYRPAWASHYPIFPGLLIVMDAPDPSALVRRTVALDHDMSISTALRSSGDLTVSVTTLEQLRNHGPHAPIFWRQDCGDYLVDLRGSPLARR